MGSDSAGKPPDPRYKNPKYTPAWAGIWWIIPIVSFYKPYDVMKELWTESHPDTEEEKGQKISTGPMSSLIGPWWIAYTASLVTEILMRFSFNSLDPTLESLMWQSRLNLLREISLLIALPMATLLVRQITSHQTEVANYLAQQETGRPEIG